MKRRIIAALAAVALGAGLLAAGAASPATASPQTVAKYVALGDSIAAGQGGGAPLDACLRTTGGYAAQLDQVPKVNLLRNAGCSGATIEDVWGQLSQVNRGTTVVTLTVGANDLHLDQIYAACVAVPSGGDINTCLGAIQGAKVAAPLLAVPLEALIDEIAVRAPNATIVVTGYPHLLEYVPDPVAPINGLIAELNGATDDLNDAIQAAADAAGAEYADVVGAFAGHGIQLAPVPSDPYFGPGLHPTYAGYTEYTEVIRAELGL